MAKLLLASIGDLLLDVVVVPRGEIRPNDDTPATVRAGGGGQAANFCAWVAALGEASRLITRVGNDWSGRSLVEELRESGVEVHPVVGPEPTGAIVVVVGDDGERSFATQRGATLHLRPDQVDPAWLAGVQLLHVPAYSLFEEPLASAILAAIDVARTNQALLSIDLSSTAGLIDYGVDRMVGLLRRLAPAILFANESEAATLGPEIDELARLVVRKLGARGCVVGGTAIAAVTADVVDTTGAGDAFAAGFCVGYLRSGDPIEAAKDAVVTAARAVTRLGGRP